MKLKLITVFVLVSLFGIFGGAEKTSAQQVVQYCDKATLSGWVTPNGTPTSAWFVWGTSSGNLNHATTPSTYNSYTSFIAEITGLSANTTYYWKAKFHNPSRGAWESPLQSFQTPPCQNATPTLDFTRSSTTAPSLLTWASTNTQSCEGLEGISRWSGNKPTSGSFDTGHIAGLITFTIKCTGTNGSVLTKSVTVSGSYTITVAINADRTNINSGESTTIRWDSHGDPNKCWVVQGPSNWQGIKPNIGTFNTGSLTSDTTYAIRCEDTNTPGSASQVASVTVRVNSTPPPTLVVTGNLTLNQSSCIIPTNSSFCNISINWSTQNANSGISVTSDKYGNISNSLSGNYVSTKVSYPNTTFTLKHNNTTLSSKTATASCAGNSNWNGSVCTINSTPLVSVNLTSDSIQAPTYIRWTSSNAISCEAREGTTTWRNLNIGTNSGSNPFDTGHLSTNTTYSIKCMGVNGDTATASRTIQANYNTQVASGVLNIDTNSCIIPKDQNACEVILKWSTSNASNPGVFKKYKGIETKLAQTISNTRGLEVNINEGVNLFELRNGTDLLDRKEASASCASATTWNGTYCEAMNDPNPQGVNITTFTASPSVLTNGSGYSTISWTAENGNYCISSLGSGTNWTSNIEKPVSGSTYVGTISATTLFRITCYGNNGSTDSEDLTITVTSATNTNPLVTTNSAANIDSDSGTLRGFVNSNYGTDTKGWFEWKKSGSNYYNETSSTYIGSTTGTDYSYTLNGLQSDTTYYFRAAAQNTNGRVVYGDERSFRTLNDGEECGTTYDDCDLYITTYEASSIERSTAVLNGYVDTAGIDTTTWFEYGTNRDSLNKTTVKDDSDVSGNFSESISNLNSSTTYYFRAVGRNSENGTKYGNILSFRTRSSGGSGGGGGYVPPPVYDCTYYGTCGGIINGDNLITISTIVASNVGQTSARLNAIAFNYSNIQNLNGYFEYGTSYSLGSTTQSKSIGSGQSIAFNDSVSGLSPNTTYYYRGVVTASTGTYRGDYKVFRTGNFVSYTGGGQTTTYSNTTVVSNSSSNTYSGTSRASLVWLDISRDEESVRQGEVLDYVVRYKNVSSRNLKSVVVRVALPGEFEFLESTRGSYYSDDNILTVNIGDLFSQEEGSFRVTIRVRETTEINKTIVITANLSYTIVDNENQEEVFAYSRNIIREGQNSINLGAASIFGYGFWPTTLIGWLLFILIILLLIALVRWLYGKSAENRMYAMSKENERQNVRMNNGGYYENNNGHGMPPPTNHVNNGGYYDNNERRTPPPTNH